MLTGPLFMLQVYDRVLASKSVPTLVALFGLVAGLYLSLGAFELIRSRALSRIAYKLDQNLAHLAKKSWIFSGLFKGASGSRPITDLTNLRQFLCSNGLPALFDLPWVPFYLAIVYLLHVWLGLLATAGAIIVIVATVINEFATKKSIQEASAWELQELKFAEETHRNAEAVVAMGMTARVSERWSSLRNNALGYSQKAGSRSEGITSFTKAVRMLVQSGMLALGAYLAIFQEITPGAMIAASILGGRALAPVDQAVGNWKNFIRSRQAYARLAKMLPASSEEEQPLRLPDPSAHISVVDLVKFPNSGAKNNGAASTGEKPILQGLQFDLSPGDALGVIGPSASGKSSLARLLVGLWMPDKGYVRFDGARFDQWDKDEIGKFIGYLPQNVELLSGTIKQNIARFNDDTTDEDVIAAAKMAGVHQLILNLPQGYSTDLTTNKQVLSGGQVQRIALARAMLHMPPLVVLDEPNSNLDSDGEIALTEAIQKLRQNGSCVIVMAHRPSAIAAVNKLLMLDAGQQVAFGDRDEVLQRVTNNQPSISTFKNKKKILKPVAANGQNDV